MRILFFSLSLFLLISGLAGAYEDSFESNNPITNRYSFHKDILDGTVADPSISYAIDPTNASNTVMKITCGLGGNSDGRFYIIPNSTQSPYYFSCIHESHGYPITGSTFGQLIIYIYKDTGELIARAETDSPYYATGEFATGKYKLEIIKDGSYYNFYVDGILKKSVVSAYPDYTGDVKYEIGLHAHNGKTYGVEFYLYLDDYTDSTIIGTKQLITESNDNVFFTWSEQLKRSYSSSNHSISLYSITNPSNAGFIKTWDISNTTLEYGAIQEGRESLLGLNYGLYQLQLTRNDALLTSTYFFYDNLASPVGYPECLFIAGANAEAEIKDQDLNGGTIEAGETTYLYPAVSSTGEYNFTYNILEAPFSLETTIETVFNTSALNQTNFYFVGLSSQSYYASVDGEEIGSTHNLDTWNYTFYNDSSNHIFNFDLDYKSPGVWGYVKNTETQNAIKSATVTISNGTNTYYITTDSNGMYYKTKDMQAGSYNISAAKTSYTSSVTYSVSTQENLTTRQDIYLEKIEGEGVYYAPHNVIFYVREYWYSDYLQGVNYTVVDDSEEIIKTGLTDSEGSFSVREMDQSINYSITLEYQGETYTKYIEPGLTEYTLTLKEGEAIHTYVNPWLTLTYSEVNGNVTIFYNSTKTINEASVIINSQDGTNFYTGTSSNLTHSFNSNLSGGGDYNIIFSIEAADGSRAGQSWSYSSPGNIDLFPDSYPAWLKNTLFGALVILFLLSFGKSKNDLACLLAAVLCSMGYFFEWIICSFNFIVLIWIIAAGAAYLHYKRTGHLG